MRLDDYLAYMAIKKSGTASYRSFKKAAALRDRARTTASNAVAKVKGVQLTGRRGSMPDDGSSDSRRTSLSPRSAQHKTHGSSPSSTGHSGTSTPRTQRPPPAELQNVDIFATGKTEEEKAAMWAMIDQYANTDVCDSDSIETESITSSEDSDVPASKRSKRSTKSSRRRKDSSSDSDCISVSFSDSDGGGVAVIKQTTGRAAHAVGGAAKMAGNKTSKAATATAQRTKEAASSLASASKAAAGNFRNKLRGSPDSGKARTKAEEKERQRAEAKAWEERMIARARERETTKGKS